MRNDLAGVDLSEQEISFPPGILKHRKPSIVPPSDERVVILKKNSKTIARVRHHEFL
jgi:hypothetical protein